MSGAAVRPREPIRSLGGDVGVGAGTSIAASKPAHRRPSLHDVGNGVESRQESPVASRVPEVGGASRGRLRSRTRHEPSYGEDRCRMHPTVVIEFTSMPVTSVGCGPGSTHSAGPGARLASRWAEAGPARLTFADCGRPEPRPRVAVWVAVSVSVAVFPSRFAGFSVSVAVSVLGRVFPSQPRFPASGFGIRHGPLGLAGPAGCRLRAGRWAGAVLPLRAAGAGRSASIQARHPPGPGVQQRHDRGHQDHPGPARRPIRDGEGHPDGRASFHRGVGRQDEASRRPPPLIAAAVGG